MKQTDLEDPKVKKFLMQQIQEINGLEHLL